MSAKSDMKEKTGFKVREPRKYSVVMYNDDFTTMEFVVEVLVDIFHKNQADAEQIMLTVHENGSAVVGLYPYDIARTRVMDSLSRAKKKGFPFRMTVEEA